MRFPYTLMGTTRSLAPYLSLRLFNGENTVTVTGLVDSGAALNVLPYDIGLSLGAVWEEQTTVIPLAGNLAAFEARALVIRAQIAELPTSCCNACRCVVTKFQYPHHPGSSQFFP